MSAELGHIALWLALGFALALSTVPIAGAARGRRDWMALARPLSWALTWAVLAAYIALTVCFVQNDFSVLYVASNSNTLLPLMYRIAAVWGGHEGSLLLWLLMLAGWTIAVAALSKSLPEAFVARTLAVMGMVSVGFLLFTLLTSNPFDRLIPAAIEGRDLNPLLQDPGMIFHPPMLYMGYVGFSVAFAFAVAALLGGNLDATWARWARPWTTTAWLFLTLGIALGSWWAYYELGWGGWWFWDPVENASFMPWLVGTALIHSLAVTEKRNAFKSWTVLLAIMAFSLSLLGTFLVRSGVLSSVHAFATDPTRGTFILGFLIVVIGGSLALYAWRAPTLGLGQRFEPVSRESFLLANNMLLAAAAGAVLLGTLYPLALDALNMGKISVGPPYFDAVFGALMLPLLVLLGIGPVVRWKGDLWREIGKRLTGAIVFAIVAAAATMAWFQYWSFWAAAGVLMGWWIVATVALELRTWWRPASGSPTGRIPRATAGMLLAHLGVAVFVFGVTGVRSLEAERDVALAPGKSAEMAGWRFTMKSLSEVDGPNYVALRGEFDISRVDGDGRVVKTLRPEKRAYRVSENPMTEAAIMSRLWGDLYISMGEPLPDGSWLVRLHVKPWVTWIWAGCVLMALGGAWAASDRRYRARRREPAPAAVAAAAE